MIEHGSLPSAEISCQNLFKRKGGHVEFAGVYAAPLAFDSRTRIRSAGFNRPPSSELDNLVSGECLSQRTQMSLGSGSSVMH